MDQVAEIREKLDIVALIGESVALKRAGRNFSGLCPFHNEKSPSFMVSPERQIWHCFGCSKGGDIYSFLMEYEHMEFPEALRTLAQRAGVTLTNQVDSGASSKKEQIYRLNGLAGEYYHFLLTKHEAGTRAREYLKKRNLDPKLIETFRLGFAPGRGNGLSRYLIGKKKFQAQDLIDAGLAFRRGSDVVDFFRGRLMFPLYDHRNNIIGFSGRVLTQEQVSKYINTRDTLAYHKSDVVYGLNLTKQAIGKEQQVILVEGEFDVMACFAGGVSNIVAVKGTALTENQIRLLGRFAPKLTFCFDGDSAGQEAIKRSLPLVEKQGLLATVVLIPEGKDPDEALTKNPSAFKKAVKEDIGAYDYILESLLAKHGTKTVPAKRAVGDAFLPLLANVKNEIIKEHYLRKFAGLLDTSYESALRELQKAVQKSKTTSETIAPLPKEKRLREEILAEYLLALLLQNELTSEIAQAVSQELAGVMDDTLAVQKLLKRMLTAAVNGNFAVKQFGQSLPKELENSYNTCLLLPLPEFTTLDKAEKEVQKTAAKLREAYLKKQISDLSDKIKKGTREGGDVSEMQEKYAKLVSLLTE